MDEEPKVVEEFRELSKSDDKVMVLVKFRGLETCEWRTKEQLQELVSANQYKKLMRQLTG